MNWVRRIQLQATDPVFEGHEANELRRVLELPSAGGSSRASIAEQARLAVACAARGELPTAIAVAGSIGARHFGPAASLLFAARDLREFVHALNAYAPLLNLRHEVRMHSAAEGQCLRLDALVELGQEEQQVLLLLDRAKIARFVGDALRTEPISVGPGLTNEPARTFIPIPPGFTARIAANGSGRSFRASEKECRERMRAIEDERLPEAVRRLLLARTSNVPDFNEIAGFLGYSRRTFRRRLAEQGTSFAEILNSVRQKLALLYLTSTDLTVDAIAEKLGYSESANFRHAFRRWTGVSPRAYGSRSSNVRVHPGEIQRRAPTVWTPAACSAPRSRDLIFAAPCRDGSLHQTGRG